MVALYFVQEQLPRTLTQKQWKAIHREWRQMKREVFETNKQRDVLLRGLPPGKLRTELLEQMINPPLVLGPGMSL